MLNIKQNKNRLIIVSSALVLSTSAMSGVLMADLSITVDDSVTAVDSGGTVTYVIEVSNAGPDDAVPITVSDFFPLGLSCSTTCVATGTSLCEAGPVVGDIDDMAAELMVMETLTYTTVCEVDVALGDVTLSNTASVSTDGVLLVDPDTSNNMATDSDTLVGPADLIFKNGFEAITID